MTTIERLRALLDEATPGPWIGSPTEPFLVSKMNESTSEEFGVASTNGWLNYRANAALIVAAVNALRPVLNALGELLAMIPEAYCVLGRFETCGDPFCSEARDRRDAILDRLDGAL